MLLVFLYHVQTQLLETALDLHGKIAPADTLPLHRILVEVRMSHRVLLEVRMSLRVLLEVRMSHRILVEVRPSPTWFW